MSEPPCAATRIQAIPTNIITGFLGVGKTTAILHLLQTKPEGERWAVLVNEFGEVGIDGSVLQGSAGVENDHGIFIKEVPGGCMCCAAGLPMQIALNTLLTKAKPQRLIIEPTGLGHPNEIVATLNAPHYRKILSLRNILTLVDARKIQNTRYTGHSIFNQQLDIADIVVANKADQYHAQDFPQLVSYLEKRHGTGLKPIYATRFGHLDPAWLVGESLAFTAEGHHHHHNTNNQNTTLSEALNFPEEGFIRIENIGEGFVSRGWIFQPDLIFDRSNIYLIFSGLNVERAKGVFITQDGIVGLNKVDDVITEIELDDSMDSRVELIGTAEENFEGVERLLLDGIQAL